MNAHREVEDALPLLALDALEPLEELTVRAHVEGCRECERLLGEFLDAAALLARSLPPVAPPAGLWMHLLREMARPGASEQTPPGRRARRPRTRLAAVFAAAAIAIPAVVAMGVDRLLDTDPDARGRSVLAEVMNDPSRQTFELWPVDGAGGASGQVVSASGQRMAAVVMRGLDDPGARIYVVWALEGSQSRPLGEFRPDSSGVAIIGVEGIVGGSTGVAVTLESGPGHARPEGPTVLRT